MDSIIGVDKKNPNPEQILSWKKEKIWGPAVYLYSITHFLILILATQKSTHLNTYGESIVLGLIVGLYTGGIGITVAHELCHKKGVLPQFIAHALLCTVWYQHFIIEHIRGHHFSVSTPDDPASARINENVYAFLVRTISGSFIHALTLDQVSALKGIAVSLTLTLVAGFFGVNSLIFFISQAFVAILLLELVNYVEHYGLSRKQLENGRYEKVLPIHSWNSAHKFSNMLLFNLQKHSDHHAMAHLPYTILKHQEQAPQLPTGYPGTILLALVPGLWFKLMNPKVERINLYRTQEK